ncbi:GntR family transcriptional regulator [[Kitasatospora] papulosa]|uniref:GntR family transcriptional regulator n=1 Tax=[Kitasatospora] papulosa TaxID=1464011 RepID=UPI0036860BA8
MTQIDDGAHRAVSKTEAATVPSPLRSAIFRVHHTPQRGYLGADQRERSRQRLRDIIEPWLPLAESHLDQATGSPSDHARWTALMAGVQSLVIHAEPSPALAELSDSVLRLLRALHEAEAGGPGVTEIADHVRTAIRDGTLLPGTKVPVGRIAADLGYSRPSEQAELAFQDLQAEKLLTFRGSIWWIAEPADQSAQVAGMIRSFLHAGVYLPGDPLPRTTELARQLATSTTALARAWAILRDEGTVVSRTGFRPETPPVLPFPVDAPLDSDALTGQLRSLALDDADLRPYVIEENCARARNWWKTRTSPPPAALEHAYGYLITAVLHLLPSSPDTAEARTRLRRIAVLALDPDGVTSSPLWRTACLAVVVGELLARNPA